MASEKAKVRRKMLIVSLMSKHQGTTRDNNVQQGHDKKAFHKRSMSASEVGCASRLPAQAK
jgi:hypothetical protein